MLTLEFWPSQPHHLLVVGEETVGAGGTFQASEEDVEGLLANPEIRRPQAAAGEQESPALASVEGTDAVTPQPDDAETQTHSPGRAERSNTTDRRT